MHFFFKPLSGSFTALCSVLKRLGCGSFDQLVFSNPPTLRAPDSTFFPFQTADSKLHREEKPRFVPFHKLPIQDQLASFMEQTFSQCRTKLDDTSLSISRPIQALYDQAQNSDSPSLTASQALSNRKKTVFVKRTFPSPDRQLQAPSMPYETTLGPQAGSLATLSLDEAIQSRLGHHTPSSH
jgi:hypothetical protein